MERADAQQLAILADEPGAAPEWMGGRREDRLIEQIFPVTREFLLADDARDHRLFAIAASDDDGIAQFRLARATELQRRQAEPVERLHEPKAGLLIEGERVGRDDAAVCAGEPDALRLGDEIADGQNKP